jgi:hypothetical protein
MTEFITVFEIGKIAATEQSPPLIIFIAGGAISFLSGVGILIARMRGKMLHLKRYIGPFLVVFGVVWLSITPSTLLYWEHIKVLENKYASKDYSVTEGIVRVLRTQPEGGHAPGDLIEVGGK